VVSSALFLRILRTRKTSLGKCSDYGSNWTEITALAGRCAPPELVRALMSRAARLNPYQLFGGLLVRRKRMMQGGGVQDA